MPDLIPAVHVHPRVKVPLRDDLGGATQRADRRNDTSSEQAGQYQRHNRSAPGAQSQGPAQLCEIGPRRLIESDRGA